MGPEAGNKECPAEADTGMGFFLKNQQTEDVIISEINKVTQLTGEVIITEINNVT